MGRPATGQIVERADTTGAVRRSLRFRVGGRRHTVPLGVVSRADAERELACVMADVARGLWKPPMVVEAPVEVEIPTFHAFSEEWWLRNEKRFAAKTRTDYRWRLEAHLLPYFAELRLDAITFDTVERYIAAKLAEDKPLSPRSINMTVILLGAILEGAVERELIARNPAKGKGRRVRERAPSRSYLETAEQIAALLEAASELDREATRERRHVERRAMLATLTFAGLRIGELCALRWRDVDLASGWLHTGSKTDAGYRVVKVRGALRDVLLDLRARWPQAGQDAHVFATRSGARMSADNVRSRTLRGAAERANANLAARGLPPLPDKLTPHSLRRTFCSLLYALGEDPGVVMDEMGHTDPGLALRVYRQSMRRGEDQKAALRALIDGGHWANMGERADMEPSKIAKRKAA
jgi:integrase